MALDPAWIAVIGTAAGAAIGTVGGALVDWAKTATQGKQQRLADAERRKDEATEAKAIRDAEAAERAAQREHAAQQAAAQRDADAAQREHELDTALRRERAAKIKEWREGLAQAHREYLEWKPKSEYESRRAVQARSPLPKPNIVGAAWFQSLRPHLPDAAGYLRTDDDIPCEDDVAHTIGEYIAVLEHEWLDG